MLRLLRTLYRWLRYDEEIRDAHPRFDLRCCWCGTMTRTTFNTVWGRPEQRGALVRLCDECRDVAVRGRE